MISKSLLRKAYKEIDFIFDEVDSKDGPENDGLLSFSELMTNHKYLTSDEELLEMVEKGNQKPTSKSDAMEKFGENYKTEDSESVNNNHNQDQAEADDLEFLKLRDEKKSAISKFIRK